MTHTTAAINSPLLGIDNAHRIRDRGRIANRLACARQDEQEAQGIAELACGLVYWLNHRRRPGERQFLFRMRSIFYPDSDSSLNSATSKPAQRVDFLLSKAILTDEPAAGVYLFSMASVTADLISRTILPVTLC